MGAPAPGGKRRANRLSLASRSQYGPAVHRLIAERRTVYAAREPATKGTVIAPRVRASSALRSAESEPPMRKRPEVSVRQSEKEFGAFSAATSEVSSVGMRPVDERWTPRMPSACWR